MAPTDQAAATTNAEYVATVYSWTLEERAEKEKKFVKKMDWRLLPILMVMYIVSASKPAGLEKVDADLLCIR
jgi:hypothetical protein